MERLTMRLVPNQDPNRIAELFEAYVQKITPKTVELKVTRMHGGKPWMTSLDHPFMQAAALALERAARHRHGEAHHETGPQPGSEQNRGAVRGVRAEDHAEDRRVEG